MLAFPKVIPHALHTMSIISYRMPVFRFALSLVFLASLRVFAQDQPQSPYLEKLRKMDAVIDKAVADHRMPGAVVYVGLGDQKLYEKAYGNRAMQPEKVPMTTDTIFDLASLSKSFGCAPSIMILADRKKLDVNDPVVKYLPAFGNHGKEKITIADLLLHHSGLIADNPESDYKNGAAAGLAAIYQSALHDPPETRFEYSDLNYIVLGEIVKAVSGQPLDQFAKENIFQPLGLDDTTYNPPASWRPRIAPTQQRGKPSHWMIGEVHDPRAYALGGVAGHAGLFSTAEDMAKFCRMILHHGQLDGHRIMSAEQVQIWTEPHYFAYGPDSSRQAGRTYGFDVDTGYSGPRGSRFPKGKSFGHTGFTGTSMWMDPGSGCFVILLTNSVHPDGSGNVIRLRGEVSSIVGEAVLGPAPK
jgi:CubicO group peptidase (beta-lactamase class C family)